MPTFFSPIFIQHTQVRIVFHEHKKGSLVTYIIEEKNKMTQRKPGAGKAVKLFIQHLWI
jgi:hypothetical protein